MQIAVCDDEKEICILLEKIVKKEYPDAVVSCYRCAEELLISRVEKDIVLLDILMPGMNGMKAAQKLRKRYPNVIIIFITAVRDYVFNAFDVGAFHYIVKPFSEEKVVCILKRAVAEKNRLNRCDNQSNQLLIKTGGINMSVKAGDIVYAEVYNRKIILHKKDEDIEYYGKMRELEKVAGEGFFRCHRAYLVNMEYIEKYNASEIYTIRGKVLMAKQKYSEFVKAYLNYNKEKRIDNE